MKYLELKALSNNLYFNSQDVAEILGIKAASARVVCTRYVKRGLFIRLKKDLYVLRERWQGNAWVDFFKISNLLQVPSYISLMTALSFYEVTTQVQRGVFESVCIRRTANYEVEDVVFNFYKLKKGLYFDFLKRDDFFIATKEKAFLDAVYLHSLGRYAFDFDSIDVNKFDTQRIRRLLRDYPERTKRSVRRLCRI